MGSRSKFHGSQVQVLTAFDAESPSIAITGISNADPAVVTAAGHGLADGDVIYITGVVGMTEVNARAFIVDVANSSTFSLFGVNSTGFGVYSSAGHFDKGNFANFCELTNYSRTGGTSPEIDVTAICDDAKEYELGLPDFGTTQLTFNFAPGTAVQGALHDLYLSGNPTAVKIILPNSAGTLVQAGFVQQETETAGVGGVWTATCTLRNTGNRFDL